MTLRIILPLALILGFAHAQATTLADYLKLRKKFGISRATTTAALETLVGDAVFEIRGQVAGTITMDGVTSLLLEVDGSKNITVKGKSVPTWLSYPQAIGRLLIKAHRDNEFAPLQAELVGAVEEGAMKTWEANPKNIKPATAGRKVPQVDTRGSSAREWNLEPNEAVPVYAEFIQDYNPRLTDAQATEIAQGIVGFSIQFGVDARLITAMVLVESGFNPSAKSRAGAMGLGQLMPGTAQGLGVRNAYDTNENLWGTVRLIRKHLDNYRSDDDKYSGLVLALAAYNAGAGAVAKHGGVPPYKETQDYIRKVTSWYRKLCGE